MNNQRLAIDTFSTGALAVGWTAITGLAACQVVGSNPYFAEPVATSTKYGQIWTGLTWPVDHAAEVTVHTLTSESGTVLSLNVRMQSGSYSGYQCDITNGTANFYKYVSGTPTTLGSGATGLTFAANDVWAFQIAGSQLTLYQNDLLVYAFADATYTSGSPGFSQSSSVAIAHTQVAAWRGYSTVQQDGIWQRNGQILLSPIAGELGGNIQGIQGCWWLFETGPVVLTGSNPVYKMWFVAVNGSGAGNISYAESYTGLPGTWVRYSGNPMLSAAGGCTAVFKYNGTYYNFVNPNSFGAIALYTSADGVTSQVSQGNILTVGSAGQWDDGNVTFFSPVYFDGTTLYALYTGWRNSTGSINTGQATSVFPFTSWTKYAGNPVVSNFWGPTIPYVSGSNFWFWGQVQNPGMESGNAIDPAQAYRMRTTPPFTTWTNKVPSVGRRQQYQGYNGPNGGGYVSFAWPAGAETWLITNNSTHDSTPNEYYATDFAVANYPIATIVANNEDGAQQLAVDNFTSGVGNLTGNWGTLTGISRLQIVAGNLCEGTSAGQNCAQYRTETFSADQYAEITIASMTAAYFIPTLRMQAGSNLNCYAVYIHSTAGSQTTVEFHQITNGSDSQIGPPVFVIWNIGDTVRFTAVGSSPVVLSVFQNGFLIAQVQDWNNTWLSGHAGLDINVPTLANGQVSYFAAGNITGQINLPAVTSTGAALLMAV